MAQAELAKVKTLLDYTKVTAPFAGVITKRYANTGSMIQAGIRSQTQAMPVVRLSENTPAAVDPAGAGIGGAPHSNRFHGGGQGALARTKLSRTRRALSDGSSWTPGPWIPKWMCRIRA